MAGSRRRGGRGTPPAPRAVVLDSEGLSAAARGDARAVRWIARARELRLPILVNAATLAETVRGTPRDAAIHLLTRHARVDPIDADFAKAAGELLGRTKRDGTIDAFVALTAMRHARPTVLLTGDPGDLGALTAGCRGVTVVPL